MHPEAKSTSNLPPSAPATLLSDLEAQPSASKAARQRRFWLAMVVLLILTLGCSAVDLFERPAPTPLPTRVLAPTFTPTPEDLAGVIIVTPPVGGTPGVIMVPEGSDLRDVIIPVLPAPTETPLPPELVPILTASAEPDELAAPSDTPTETPTITPTETETPTPTITPTPFIVVEAGLVALRSGPGVEFPLVAQLGPNIPIAVTGQNTEGTWYQLCCVNGATVWVVAAHVAVNNDPRSVALLIGGTPPSPTPTLPATPTGTPTFTPTATPYPFLRSIGPQFFQTENRFITIWVKLHVGTLRLFTGCDPDNTTADKEVPAAGYFLKVLFNDFERPPTNGVQISTEEFSCSAAIGAGNRFEYNLKYEYQPPDPRSIVVGPQTPTPSAADLIGNGTWTIYIIDGAGNKLSDEVTFTSQPSNPNREIYVGWERIR